MHLDARASGEKGVTEKYSSIRTAWKSSSSESSGDKKGTEGKWKEATQYPKVRHRNYSMKDKLIGMVKTAVIVLVGVAIGLGIMIGAVLQESYKLCPVTAEETSAEVVRK